MKVKRRISQSLTIAAIVIAVFISACSQGADTPTSQNEQTATAFPSESPATQPVLEAKPLAILISQDTSDALLRQEVEETMRTRLEPLGWQVEVRGDVASDESASTVKLIVALPPYPLISEIAAANPGKQVIAVGFPGVPAGTNLSVIGGDEAAAAQLGFIAGYAAAVITEDWRVGVISTDTPSGQQYRQGFLTGARYFCGLCLQNYPPYYEYPLSALVPAGATLEQLQSAANQLIGQSVTTIYLAPGAGNTGVYEYLSQAGIAILGSDHGSDPRPATWAAGIDHNLIEVFQQALEAYLAGEGSSDFLVGISIFNVNPDWISGGKIEHIESVIADLLAGWISPFEATP